MPRIELSDIDLNLLVLFLELLRQRSVSAAAASLGISQPAASNALARLRRALGDRLAAAPDLRHLRRLAVPGMCHAGLDPV